MLFVNKFFWLWLVYLIRFAYLIFIVISKKWIYIEKSYLIILYFERLVQLIKSQQIQKKIVDSKEGDSKGSFKVYFWYLLAIKG